MAIPNLVSDCLCLQFSVVLYMKAHWHRGISESVSFGFIR